MKQNKVFVGLQPWISLIVRISMGIIMVWAGVAKMLDLPGSVRAVRAYHVLPEAVVPTFGTVLPFAEILLGFVLIAGIASRWAAVGYLALIGGFLLGFFWAWHKGYQIDCGCFGGGGELAAGQDPGYVGHLMERIGFLALGTWLVVFPRSRFSLDGWLHPTT